MDTKELAGNQEYRSFLGKNHSSVFAGYRAGILYGAHKQGLSHTYGKG